MGKTYRAKDGRPHPILTGVEEAVHAVQFYETETFLLDTLTEYVGGAIETGQAAIVIATDAHCDGLDRSLAARGIDVEAAKRSGAYRAVDAQETLGRFMRGGSVDTDRFDDVVGGLVLRARGEGGTRHVRAFGEMVALLWADGHREAALSLEDAWNALARRMTFALICAYPVRVFTDNDRADGAFASVTGLHQTSALPPSSRPRPGVPYRTDTLTRLTARARGA